MNYEEPRQTMEIAKMSDLQQSLLYKLRLNKLDKTNRTLQRRGIIDSRGFLTVDGAQVFLDALWQSNPEVQKNIADSILEMERQDKKDKNSKNAD